MNILHSIFILLFSLSANVSQLSEPARENIKITAEDIKQSIDIYDLIDQSECEVLSFKLIFVPKKRDPQIYNNQSEIIEAKIIIALQQAKAGDHIYIDNIIESSPCTAKRKLYKGSIDILVI